MDYRDVAGHYRAVLQDLNVRAMTATFTVEDEDGLEVEHTVHLKFAVCDTCDGRGSYVNPSIDSQGLTAEDFADDPDFAEDYRRGSYDQSCAQCGGARVVPVVDEDTTPAEIVARYQQREQDAWDAAREETRARECGY